MDDDQSGRGDLTAEQRQQRYGWAREMWDADYDSPEWRAVTDCIRTVRPRNGKWGLVLLSEAFKEPHRHNDFLDAVFEEYATRKLLGEIT